MYNITAPFTLFQGIVSSLPTEWKNDLNTDSKVEDRDQDVECFLIDTFKNLKGVSTKFYKILLTEKVVKPTQVLNRWERELGVDINIKQWIKSLTNTRIHTSCNRIRRWAYKFWLGDVPLIRFKNH